MEDLMKERRQELFVALERLNDTLNSAGYGQPVAKREKVLT